MKFIYKVGLFSFLFIFFIWNAYLPSSAFAVSTSQIENKNAPLIRVLNNLGYEIDTYSMVKGNDKAMKQATDKVKSLPVNEQGNKGTIEVPEGKWNFKNEIFLPEGATLRGKSQKTILVRRFGEFPKKPIEIIDGKEYYQGIIRMQSHTALKNITLDGEKGNEKSNSLQNGIVARGHYTEGGEATLPHESDYLKDIMIEDVVIRNVTGDGITLDLIKGLHIKGSKSVAVDGEKRMLVENAGNSGIIGYSIETAEIQNVVTRNIGGENDKGIIGKNYNIALSMRKMKEPPNPGYKLQAKYPISKNVKVRDSVFIDNCYWEGLDTHSGENMEFTNNIFVGIARPIVIGGLEYRGKYYYPPKKITVEKNYINDAGHIHDWKPKNKEKSKVGIAVWGTNQTFPIEKNGKLLNPLDEGYKENIGYIKETKIMNNVIEQVEPEDDSSGFGGVALKLTEGILVENNQIGWVKSDSVKRGGIILNNSNKEFEIRGNQVGWIQKSSLITDDTKQKGHAPIEIIGTGNNGSVTDNCWNENNKVGINDEKYGDYTNNKLSGVESNKWRTGKPYDENGYNYGLSKLKWDTKEGVVTGKAGKDVGSVMLKYGNAKLVETNVSNQQFTLTTDELKHGDKKFQIVARNSHINPKYRYEVHSEELIK